VSLGDSQPKEEDGKWKLKMTMTYGGTPPTAHIPMNFSFTPTVLYERSLNDKSPNTPVITRIPLSNQQPIIKSMDVGFSDPSGKLFSTTKFDFVIRRDHGFEAGEYTLVITRSNDGAQMGQQIRIVLQGDNEIVDRRAIVFTGEKKKEKKADPAADKKDEPAADPEPGDPGAGDPSASTDTPTEAPPPVEPKQGGCGCRVAEPAPAPGLALFAAAGLLAFAARRRSKSGDRSRDTFASRAEPRA
jgi:MYXO-CTERM domain-containing protein